MIHVGLRIDVDTLRGTRFGVPNLLALLARHHIRASFFFSVGPDNMGRHLWRLVQSPFLSKMIRTRAAKLYGWDILLRGTLWPGPVIGKQCPDPIQAAARAGHETGLHAWDHYRWQKHILRMDRHTIADEVQKGYCLMTRITGRSPEGFAAPAWRVTPQGHAALEAFNFRYRSDCRGHSLFRPVVDSRLSRQVQVPTTLPTYDELVGRKYTPRAYNDYLLKQIRPERLNVLTIHAEVEGISCLPLFQDFLTRARHRDIVFESIGGILSQTVEMEIGYARIEKSTTAGRDGWLARQGWNSLPLKF
jgi:undecaprenyl phosphate-alpha-L-ara4FN deformylase